MKHLLIVLLAFFIVSCNHKESTGLIHSNRPKIDSIEVLFYNMSFESIKLIKCEEIIYKASKEDLPETFGYHVGILDTTIVNKNALYSIEQELDSLQTSDIDYIDARMKCFIHYADKHLDTLCINDIPNYAIYNSRHPVKLSNKLVYLLRKNCGFYEWIGISEFPYFNELNDTTFVRETIINRWGQSY